MKDRHPCPLISCISVPLHPLITSGYIPAQLAMVRWWPPNKCHRLCNGIIKDL